ncbi:histidine kinase [Rheinheimera sp. YQF-2]|uniref:Histidine kinase n=1 Tax=Rheinheimera lutimaris TaxID=2740584 RepID=A0A7Y5AV01_9GAMM|nr:histidine kinase [Rheinheimera lutimaris]NRQ44376.1 histidine kinase [Rheinheimera lutimaris]
MRSARFISLLVLAVATFLYINLAVIQQYGQTNFYHPVEHIGLAIYCLISLITTRFTIRLNDVSTKPQSIFSFIKIILISGLAASLLVTLIWLLIRSLVMMGSDEPWMMNWMYVIGNMLFVFFYVHIIFSSTYLSFAYHHRLKAENNKRISAEKARAAAKLKLLHEQVAPHFLFNSLNTLSSLIEVNQPQAQLYVIRLAELYRFMLRNRDHDVISLAEEVNFTKTYVSISNIRFGDAYHLKIDHYIDDPVSWYLPPGALQTLVENAIKHNEASSTEVLDIHIYIQEETITVLNQRRVVNGVVASTKTGLANLKARYAMLTSSPVLINKSEEFFSVQIPLIKEITDL